MEKNVSLKVPQTGFTKLLQEYTSNGEVLHPFVQDFPSIAGFQKQIASTSFSSEKRSILVKALCQQYAAAEMEVPALVNELLHENTFTVTTGHQLALFGGPKYFIHKIVSIIQLSKTLNEKLDGKKIIPMFWLASEDHDYDEINSVKFFGARISSKKTAEGPVGLLEVNHFADAFIEFKKVIGTSKEAHRITEIFGKAFKKKTWADATRYWVQELFGEELVIIDGDDRLLKSQIKNVFEDELFQNKSFENIEASSRKLEALGFHSQVTPRLINLFYCEKGLRERIVKTATGFSVLNTDIAFSNEEMKDLIAQNPEKLSPNAILRPLFEEVVLPNLAYIGGPGELAYWLQLKSNFDYHRVAFPLLVLRDSFVWVKQKDLELLTSYQLDFSDLGLKNELLIQKYLDLNTIPKVDFEDDKKALGQLTQRISDKANQLIKNHEKMLDAEFHRWNQFFDKLALRVRRDSKLREGVAIQKLTAMQTVYFPNGKLNERSLGFFEDLIHNGWDAYFEALLGASDVFDSRLKLIVSKC